MSRRLQVFLACMVTVCLGWSAGCARVEDTIRRDVDVTAGTIDELLDQYTESRRVGGSDWRLLPEATESYEVFAELIQNATHHLHVVTLNFDDDTQEERDIGLEFAEMLADKARQGVQVRVMLDPFNQNLLSRPQLQDVLRAGGVEVRDYRPPSNLRGYNTLLYRTHKKLLVADGRRAVVGSANFGFRYLAPGRWRDTNVLLTGPVVAVLQDEFIRDWSAIGGQLTDDPAYYPPLPPTGTLVIRPIDQRPGLGDFDINNALLVAIRSARNSITLESPYFNPTDWFVRELIDAAGRGVMVMLLTNSIESTDFPVVVNFGATFFDDLLDAGVHIKLWLPPGRNLHSKIFVADDHFAMVGSYNLNNRSIAWDTENAVIVTDPAAVAQVQAILDHDACCEQVMEIDRVWLQAHRAAYGDLTGFGSLFDWIF